MEENAWSASFALSGNLRTGPLAPSACLLRGAYCAESAISETQLRSHPSRPRRCARSRDPSRPQPRARSSHLIHGAASGLAHGAASDLVPVSSTALHSVSPAAPRPAAHPIPHPIPHSVSRPAASAWRRMASRRIRQRAGNGESKAERCHRRWTAVGSTLEPTDVRARKHHGIPEHEKTDRAR